MARTLVIGLTESGTKTTVNEDTFSLGGRVYPDMITGSEERSAQSSDYTQLYVVTEGHGGSGVGDLAGRLVQRTAMDLVDLIASYKQPDLDFQKFCRDLISEAHARVTRQIKARDREHSGASMALLLIDSNVAHLLNVGDTSIHLFRNNKLMFPTCSPGEQQEQSDWVIGDMTRNQSSAAITIKQFTLRAGDIVLLSSKGFCKDYPGEAFASDLASPDAFAATIRQAQIHSRQFNDTVNGTIMAVKVRDLELSEPGDRVPESEVRRAIYHNGKTLEPSETVEPETNGRPEAALPLELPEDDIDMKKGLKRERRKRNTKTFFLFLLLGFLVGLATILIIWFIILS